MKINLKLFFSIFITTISVSAQNQNNNGNGFKGFPIACKNEMLQVEKCLSQRITKENLIGICTAAKSELCQQFYTNPMGIVPSCNNFKSLITISANVFSNSVSLMCETDENGNICPFTEYEIFASNNGNNNAVMNNNALNAIKYTCVSNKCTIATRKYIQYLIDNNEIVIQIISANYRFSNIEDANREVMNSLNIFMSILNSDDCKSLHNEDNYDYNAPPTEPEPEPESNDNPVVAPEGNSTSKPGANSNSVPGNNNNSVPANNNNSVPENNNNSIPGNNNNSIPESNNNSIPEANNNSPGINNNSPGANNNSEVNNNSGGNNNSPGTNNNLEDTSDANNDQTVPSGTNDISNVERGDDINQTPIQIKQEEQGFSVTGYIVKPLFFLCYLIIYCLSFKYFLL